MARKKTNEEILADIERLKNLIKKNSAKEKSDNEKKRVTKLITIGAHFEALFKTTGLDEGKILLDELLLRCPDLVKTVQEKKTEKNVNNENNE